MDERLLHPNLLSNDDIKVIIKDRQLDIQDLERLDRSQLMELFKKHIMPKPQRRQKNDSRSSSSTTNSETTDLSKEVKRIKLSRVNSQTPMDCTPAPNCDSGFKRRISESPTDNKRQRIQWP